jgi:hypothetical protein
MEKESEEDEWTCRNCGSTDPHHEMKIGPIEIDVTCETVYLLPVDEDWGLAFDHDQFEDIVEHFENRDN